MVLAFELQFFTTTTPVSFFRACFVLVVVLFLLLFFLVIYYLVGAYEGLGRAFYITIFQIQFVLPTK